MNFQEELSFGATSAQRAEGEMFVDFYSLREDPFKRVDPRFIYLSANHRKALASLHYGIERGDRIQLLLADAGIGKTILLRHLCGRLQTSAQITMISAAAFQEAELLKSIGNCTKGQREEVPGAKPEAVISPRFIVLIDDAQDLGDGQLGSILSLACADLVEVPKRMGVHIILAGRPRLLEKLRQLNSTNKFREVLIAPMDALETREYINHRLRMASGTRPALFTPAAYVMIAEQSGGVPGIINSVSAKALAMGARRGLRQIDTSILDRNAADEGKRFVIGPFDPEAHASWPLPSRYIPAWPWLALMFILLVAAGAGFWYQSKAPVHTSSSGAANRKPADSSSTAKLTLPRQSATIVHSQSAPHAALQSQAPRASVSTIVESPPHAAMMAQPTPEKPSIVAQDHAQAPAPNPSVAVTISPKPDQNAEHPRIASPIRETASVAQPSKAAAGPIKATPVIDPHQAQIDAEVGDDYMRLGKYEQAIEFYQDAIILAPGDPQIERKIAQARIAQARE
jgi:general secretion pathway protein A